MRMSSNILARRSPLGVVAVAVLGVCVLRSVPGAWVRASAEVAELLRHAGESFAETRVRVYGKAYASRIDEIRGKIPETGAYLLVDAAGATDGKPLVRHDLAPRRPVAPYLIAAAGPIGIALAAYAVHFNPPALASTTWTRFLIQASIPLAAVFAACAREASRRLPTTS